MIEMNTQNRRHFPMISPINTISLSVCQNLKIKRKASFEKVVDRMPSGIFKYPDMFQDGSIYDLTAHDLCQICPEFKDFFHTFFQRVFMDDQPQHLKTKDKIVDFAIKHGIETAVTVYKLSKRCIEKRAKKHTGRALGDLRRDYIDTHVKSAMDNTNKKWSVREIEKILKDTELTGSIRTNEIKKSLERINTHV